MGICARACELYHRELWHKVADAQHTRSSVSNNCRGQFVDRDGLDAHPGFEIVCQQTGFLGRVGLHDTQMCIHSLRAFIIYYFQQALQSPPLGSLLFKGLNLAVPEAQNGLNLQQLPLLLPFFFVKTLLILTGLHP